MTPPVLGRVDEHPAPMIIGALATRAWNGVLRFEQDGRAWTLFWRDGAIVAGESASPEDQFGRVALEAGLIDPVAVGESLRRMAASPGRPQSDILVEMGKLTPADAERALRACLARQAARVFSLVTASYEAAEGHQQGGLGGPLDARWVIYRGLRVHYDDRRLERELSRLGGKAVKLQVEPAAIQDDFGFADDERIVLAYLQKGYWELADLIDACVSLARGTVLAVVYSLLAAEYLDAQPAESVPRLRKRVRESTQRLETGTHRIPTAPQPARPPQPTPSAAIPAAAPRPPQPTPPRATAVATTRQPLTTPSTPLPAAPRPPQPTPPRPVAVEPRTAQGSPAGPAVADAITDKLRDQILGKARQVDGGADHFLVLEVDRSASKDQVRSQYFALAKMYHPDRLALVKLEELRPQVERVFARLSEAFGVLSDDARRKEYLKVLAEGGEAAVRSKEDKEAARAVAILSSEEHFRRGEMALRRQVFAQALEEFKKALDLNPEEGEHHAMHAWAQWCTTADKDRIAADVKRGLTRALELNPKCVAAFFYLGQVYKHLGDMERAHSHFSRVISLAPSHVDAERELRVLEMRKNKATEKKGSFFDRFKKK